MVEEKKIYNCILTIQVGDTTITREETNFKSNRSGYEDMIFIKNLALREADMEDNSYAILFWFQEEVNI